MKTTKKLMSMLLIALMTLGNISPVVAEESNPEGTPEPTVEVVQDNSSEEVNSEEAITGENEGNETEVVQEQQSEEIINTEPTNLPVQEVENDLSKTENDEDISFQEKTEEDLGIYELQNVPTDVFLLQSQSSTEDFQTLDAGVIIPADYAKIVYGAGSGIDVGTDLTKQEGYLNHIFRMRDILPDGTVDEYWVNGLVKSTNQYARTSGVYKDGTRHEIRTTDNGLHSGLTWTPFGVNAKYTSSDYCGPDAGWVDLHVDFFREDTKQPVSIKGSITIQSLDSDPYYWEPEFSDVGHENDGFQLISGAARSYNGKYIFALPNNTLKYYGNGFVQGDTLYDNVNTPPEQSATFTFEGSSIDYKLKHSWSMMIYATAAPLAPFEAPLDIQKFIETDNGMYVDYTTSDESEVITFVLNAGAGNERDVNRYTSWVVEDEIDPLFKFVPGSVKILRANDQKDLSAYFDVSFDESTNKLTVSAKSGTLAATNTQSSALNDSNNFYGNMFDISYDVQRIAQADMTPEELEQLKAYEQNGIPNKAKITVERLLYGNAQPAVSKESNEVHVKYRHKIDTLVTNGTITVNENGEMGTQGRVGKILKGDDVTINFQPNQYHYLSEVLVDDQPMEISEFMSEYTFENVQEDHKIEVVYEPYTLEVHYLEEGTEVDVWTTHVDHTLGKGESYSVSSPEIEGYELVNPEQDTTVTGTMPDYVHSVNVYYKKTTMEAVQVGVYKSAEPVEQTVVSPGDEITYFLRAKNSGIKKSSTITINDTIPAGTTLVEGSISDGGSVLGETIMWTIEPLESMAEKTVSFKVKVNEDFDSIVYNIATYHTERNPQNMETNIVEHPTDMNLRGPASLTAVKGSQITTTQTTYTTVNWTTKEKGNPKFSYTGRVQQFTAPAEGDYKLEVWGAAGGGGNGKDANDPANGGYSYGTIHLNKDEVLYVIVGGKGGRSWSTIGGGGYNGGGGAWYPTNGWDCYGGGGMTHISRTSNPAPSNENGSQTWDPTGTIIVAGGGGGSDDVGNPSGYAPGGAGGGLRGGGGATWAGGGGGTQTSGYKQGMGQSVRNHTMDANDAGAGGGGWYGGYAGGNGDAGGGGGSGYISPELTDANTVANHSYAYGNGEARITYDIDVHNTRVDVETNTVTIDGDEGGTHLDVEHDTDVAAGVEYISETIITYNIAIGNSGGAISKETVIVDYIPEGTTYVEGSATNGGVYNAEKNRIEWYLGDIEVGQNQVVSFKVKPTGDVQLIQNQALFDRDVKEENISNTDPQHKTNIVEHVVNNRINIKKIWDDSNNAKQLRPSSITLHIDGTDGSSKIVTLEASENWEKTVYIKMEDTVDYYVWEEPISVYYESNATENSKMLIDKNTGIVDITNTLKLYKVTTEVVNGTIDDDVLDIPKGNNATIKYNPNEGHSLDYIEIDGNRVDANGIENEYTFSNIQADHHIKVVYFAPQKPVKMVKNEEGEDINKQYIPFDSELYYEIKIKNTATTTKMFNVTDTIPAGTEFVLADNNGVLNDGKVSWSVNMEPNEEKVLSFVVLVVEDDIPQIDNTATQTVDGHDMDTNTVTNYTPFSLNPEGFKFKDVLNADEESIDGLYVNKGDNLYYVVIVKNSSDQTKTFTVKDELPEHTEFISVEDGTFSDGVITWVRDIPAHRESEFKFVAKAKDSGAVITNIAKVSVDGIIDSETNDVNNFTPAEPIKSVADSENNDINEMMVLVGDELTYYIRVKNISFNETDVVVKDALSEHLEFISADNNGVLKDGTVTWEMNLASSQEVLLSFKARILESGKGKVIENQADVVFEDVTIPTNKTNNPVMPDPVKTVTANGVDVNGQTVDVGTRLLYTISFENVGDGEKEFTITDTLPNNTEFIEVKDGGDYASSTKTFTWTKTLSAKEKGSVSFIVETTRFGSYIPNVATVEVDAKSINTNKVDNTTPDPVVKGDLVSVYKESNPVSGTTVKAGDVIEYTLTAVNTGNATSGITTIVDPLASEITYIEDSASDGGVYENGEITWKIEGIEPQGFKTVSFKAKVNDNAKDVLIRNYALYTTTTDKNEGMKTTNEVIHPVGNTDLVSALDAYKEVKPNGMVRQNDLLDYYVTIRNNGGTSLDTVMVDTIPEGTEFVSVDDGVYNRQKNRVEWYIGTLEKDAIETRKFTVRVKIEEGVIYNQARFDNNVPEEELSNASLKNTTNITENPVEPYYVHGDLVTVHKSSDPISGSKVEHGQVITYYLNVINTGNFRSGKTTIKDMIPEHTSYVDNSASHNGKLNDGQLTWEIEGIMPGEMETIEFKVKVNDEHNVIIRNHATYSTNTDKTPGEKSTNEVVHGTDDAPIPPVLEITKYNNPVGMVKNGQEIVYTLILKNNGGNISKDTVVTDDIPEYVEVIEVSENGKIHNDKRRIEWYLGDVEAGESVTIGFAAKVTGTSGMIYNQAKFDYMITRDDLPNSELKNSSNIVENPIEEPPVVVKGDYVTVTKSSNPKSGSLVETGQEITYMLTLKNTGTTKSSKTTITDKLSIYLDYVEGSASDGGQFKDGVLSWTIGGIEPNKEKTITFKAKVKEDAKNVIIKNHAVYQSDTDKDTNPKNTNEVVHGTGTAEIPPVLDLVKVSNKTGEVKTGDEITYTLAITNNGGTVSKDTVITDSIPVGTTYVLVQNDGSHNSTKKRVEWYLGDLKPNETKKVSFKVKVTDTSGKIDNQGMFDNGVPKDQLSSTELKNYSNIVQNVIKNPAENKKQVVPFTGDQTDLLKYSILLVGGIIIVIISKKILTKYS